MKSIGNKRRILSIIAVITMLTAVFAWGGATADSAIWYSGDWGSLHWEFNHSNELTISGSGPMDDCPEHGGAGWRTETNVKDNARKLFFDGSITTIGKYAFYQLYNLSHEVALPSTLTAIGDYAFYYCNLLPSITIPNSVTSIGAHAFHFCGELTGVTLPRQLKTIGDSCFAGDRKIKSITIPAKVTSIGSNAFNSCYLTSVSFSGNPTSIGEYAFSYSSFTTFTVPSGIQRLEEGLFNSCSNLTRVEIPVSVNYIANSVFSGCTNLKKIVYAGTQEQWEAITKDESWDATLEAGNYEVIFSTPSTYKVTFDSNGHGTDPAATTVTGGSTISAPDSPSAEGWTFTGWYRDEECQTPWNFSSDTVDGNMILYAGWVQTPKVTLNTNGHGTAPEYVYAERIAEGSGYVWRADNIPDPTEEGWDFTGWYTDPGLDENAKFDGKLTGDMTIYAAWTRTVQVTFFDMLTYSKTTITVPYDSLIDEPAHEEIEGIDFLGWFRDVNTEPVQWDFANDKVKADLELTGRYHYNEGTLYTGYYDRSSGQWWVGGQVEIGHAMGDDTILVDSEGCSFPVPEPVYPLKLMAQPDEGFGFVGWYQSSEQQDIQKLLSSESTYEVSFREDQQKDYVVAVFCKQYTVTFTGDGGAVLQTVKVNEGDTPKYTGATPTKAADAKYTYSFDGWDASIVAAAADATYKAKFKATEIPVSPAPGGQSQTPTTPEKTDPQPGTQPEPQEPAKAPAGEYTDPTVGTVVVDDSGNATFKAPAGNKASVVIPDTVTVNGVEAPVTKIADNAFKKNKKLTTVSIGSNVKTIGSGAFSSCAKLKTIKGGSQVQEIGKNAFASSKKLKTVPNMPNLKKIGDSAFKGCVSLTKVTIGAAVTSIGKSAFSGCSKLKTVTIKSTKLTKKNVKSGAFKGIPDNATVKCPKSVKKAYAKWLPKKGLPKTAKIK